MMINDASKMLALIVLTNLAVAIFLRLKSIFLQIYTGYLIPFMSVKTLNKLNIADEGKIRTDRQIKTQTKQYFSFFPLPSFFFLLLYINLTIVGIKKKGINHRYLIFIEA
ncbi:MAG: hypothetical protein F6K07_09855 [Okeania sp. SIO1H5]|nr:hypothetical protein [Okeania sp. SIO1H5]